MSEKRNGKDEARSDTKRSATNSAGVVSVVREQFGELTGLTAEGVSSLARNGDDGWTLHVEVLEVPRVPDTTSLLATYEVDADPDGQLTGYRRLRRYERGRPDPQ
ncbi:gas vesicle protein GvpO [Streptomyces sp. 184]|uniref:gas vesicle protein GvpO n=1 Tax=Streptomyces sp. 184 TaxID=1827526 RepID=UPI003891AEE0